MNNHDMCHQYKQCVNKRLIFAIGYARERIRTPFGKVASLIILSVFNHGDLLPYFDTTFGAKTQRSRELKIAQKDLFSDLIHAVA